MQSSPWFENDDIDRFSYTVSDVSTERVSPSKSHNELRGNQRVGTKRTGTQKSKFPSQINPRDTTNVSPISTPSPKRSTSLVPANLAYPDHVRFRLESPESLWEPESGRSLERQRPGSVFEWNAPASQWEFKKPNPHSHTNDNHNNYLSTSDQSHLDSASTLSQPFLLDVQQSRQKVIPEQSIVLEPTVTPSLSTISIKDRFEETNIRHNDPFDVMNEHIQTLSNIQNLKGSDKPVPRYIKPHPIVDSSPRPNAVYSTHQNPHPEEYQESPTDRSGYDPFTDVAWKEESSRFEWKDAYEDGSDHMDSLRRREQRGDSRYRWNDDEESTGHFGIKSWQRDRQGETEDYEDVRKQVSPKRYEVRHGENAIIKQQTPRSPPQAPRRHVSPRSLQSSRQNTARSFSTPRSWRTPRSPLTPHSPRTPRSPSIPDSSRISRSPSMSHSPRTPRSPSIPHSSRTQSTVFLDLYQQATHSMHFGHPDSYQVYGRSDEKIEQHLNQKQEWDDSKIKRRTPRTHSRAPHDSKKQEWDDSKIKRRTPRSLSPRDAVRDQWRHQLSQRQEWDDLKIKQRTPRSLSPRDAPPENYYGIHVRRKRSSPRFGSTIPEFNINDTRSLPDGENQKMNGEWADHKIKQRTPRRHSPGQLSENSTTELLFHDSVLTSHHRNHSSPRRVGSPQRMVSSEEPQGLASGPSKQKDIRTADRDGKLGSGRVKGIPRSTPREQTNASTELSTEDRMLPSDNVQIHSSRDVRAEISTRSPSPGAPPRLGPHSAQDTGGVDNRIQRQISFEPVPEIRPISANKYKDWQDDRKRVAAVESIRTIPAQVSVASLGSSNSGRIVTSGTNPRRPKISPANPRQAMMSRINSQHSHTDPRQPGISRSDPRQPGIVLHSNQLPDPGRTPQTRPDLRQPVLNRTSPGQPNTLVSGKQTAMNLLPRRETIMPSDHRHNSVTRTDARHPSPDDRQTMMARIQQRLEGRRTSPDDRQAVMTRLQSRLEGQQRSPDPRQNEMSRTIPQQNSVPRAELLRQTTATNHTNHAAPDVNTTDYSSDRRYSEFSFQQVFATPASKENLFDPTQNEGISKNSHDNSDSDYEPIEFQTVIPQFLDSIESKSNPSHNYSQFFDGITDPYSYHSYGYSGNGTRSSYKKSTKRRGKNRTPSHYSINSDHLKRSPSQLKKTIKKRSPSQRNNRQSSRSVSYNKKKRDPTYSSYGPYTNSYNSYQSQFGESQSRKTLSERLSSSGGRRSDYKNSPTKKSTSRDRQPKPRKTPSKKSYSRERPRSPRTDTKESDATPYRGSQSEGYNSSYAPYYSDDGYYYGSPSYNPYHSDDGYYSESRYRESDYRYSEDEYYTDPYTKSDYNYTSYYDRKAGGKFNRKRDDYSKHGRRVHYNDYKNDNGKNRNRDGKKGNRTPSYSSSCDTCDSIWNRTRRFPSNRSKRKTKPCYCPPRKSCEVHGKLAWNTKRNPSMRRYWDSRERRYYNYPTGNRPPLYGRPQHGPSPYMSPRFVPSPFRSPRYQFNFNDKIPFPYGSTPGSHLMQGRGPMDSGPQTSGPINIDERRTKDSRTLSIDDRRTKDSRPLSIDERRTKDSRTLSVDERRTKDSRPHSFDGMKTEETGALELVEGTKTTYGLHSELGYDIHSESTADSSHGKTQPRTVFLSELPKNVKQELQPRTVFLSELPKNVKQELDLAADLCNPQVEWDHIIGYTAVKRMLRSYLVINNNQPVCLRRIKGVLIAGPSGCAKTLMGQALVSDLGASLLAISIARFSNVEEAAEVLGTLFSLAEKRKPCVLMLDDIDVMFRSSAIWSHGQREKIQALFMAHLISLKDPLIKILCISSQPTNLDPILLKLLPIRLYVPLPDREHRELIIHNCLKFGLAELNFNKLQIVAKMTEGYSGRDLISLVTTAIVLANDRLGDDVMRPSPVDMNDFTAAFALHPPSISEAEIHKYNSWFHRQGGTPEDRDRNNTRPADDSEEIEPVNTIKTNLPSILKTVDTDIMVTQSMVSPRSHVPGMEQSNTLTQSNLPRSQSAYISDGTVLISELRHDSGLTDHLIDEVRNKSNLPRAHTDPEVYNPYSPLSRDRGGLPGTQSVNDEFSLLRLPSSISRSGQYSTGVFSPKQNNSTLHSGQSPLGRVSTNNTNTVLSPFNTGKYSQETGYHVSPFNTGKYSQETGYHVSALRQSHQSSRVTDRSKKETSFFHSDSSYSSNDGEVQESIIEPRKKKIIQGYNIQIHSKDHNDPRSQILKEILSSNQSMDMKKTQSSATFSPNNRLSSPTSDVTPNFPRTVASMDYSDRLDSPRTITSNYSLQRRNSENGTNKQTHPFLTAPPGTIVKSNHSFVQSNSPSGSALGSDLRYYGVGNSTRAPSFDGRQKSQEAPFLHHTNENHSYSSIHSPRMSKNVHSYSELQSYDDYYTYTTDPSHHSSAQHLRAPRAPPQVSSNPQTSFFHSTSSTS